MTRSTVVLICAREPIVGALLGILAEMARCVPAFPQAGEQPEDALLRVRPVLAILLDDSLDAARSDLFYARAAKGGVRLALFGSPDRSTIPRAGTTGRGVPWVQAPTNLEQFERILDVATAVDWWRSGSDRRRADERPHSGPGVDRTSDGKLVYTDPQGSRWSVYDRRSSGRRRPGRHGGEAQPTTGTPVDGAARIFVSEGGEARRCALRQEELDEHTADALQAQLDRAERV